MSGMIEVKVSELTGAALDYAVEIAISGFKPSAKHAFAWQYQNEDRKYYSTNWRDGGPLITGHKVSISLDDDCWYAAFMEGVHHDQWSNAGSGDTPLIAACRAIVIEKLGEAIMLPSRLFQ